MSREEALAIVVDILDDKEPFIHLENCLKGATEGLRELRGMGKSIERFIRRQLEARTLGENYAVVCDQYAEQVGHECYAGLVRAQLPARIDAARERARQILDATELLHKMQPEMLSSQRLWPRLWSSWLAIMSLISCFLFRTNREGRSTTRWPPKTDCFVFEIIFLKKCRRVLRDVDLQ